MLGLLSALRAPHAAAAVRALAEVLAPAGAEDLMTLERNGGDGPAHHAAAALVADLSAWRRGDAEWRELSHSLLLSGPAGTGKSVLARGIAASAGVPLIETSFGTWQASGHLGDMLREMRRSFSDALRKKPSVLFIDEADAAGSRDSPDRHGSSYRAQVINQFLAEIDQLQHAEGVLLIGATNHGEPWIRRSSGLAGFTCAAASTGRAWRRSGTCWHWRCRMPGATSWRSSRGTSRATPLP